MDKKGKNYKQADAEKVKTSASKTTKSESKRSGTRSGYAVFAVLLVAVAIILGFYWNQTTSITNIDIKGNYYTDKGQILKHANIPNGVNPDSIDALSVIMNIERLPYIKEARLTPNPPDKMVISVTERTPLALLLDGSKRAYVDEAGIQLPLVLTKSPDVPLLYGFSISPDDTLKSEQFEMVRGFLQGMSHSKISNITLSEIAVTADQGIVVMTTDNGVKIIFGDESPAERLESWESFYKQLVPKIGINNLSEVDLRYKGQIITRKL